MKNKPFFIARIVGAILISFVTYSILNLVISPYAIGVLSSNTYPLLIVIALIGFLIFSSYGLITLRKWGINAITGLIIVLAILIALWIPLTFNVVILFGSRIWVVDFILIVALTICSYITHYLFKNKRLFH